MVTAAARSYCCRLACATLLTVSLFAAAPVFAMQLTDFKWKNRLLLIFAPDQQDPVLQQTRRAVEQRSCALDDRNMILGIFVGHSRNGIDGFDISNPDAAAIRHRFGIRLEQFALVLIGKDGTEKFRSYQTPDLDAIFTLIDGMPMRRDEMANDPSDCDPPSPSVE